MAWIRSLILLTCLTALTFPSISLAKNDKGGNAGGKASEHRSDTAEEHSNAQWSDDATKGSEKPADQKTKDDPNEDDKAKADNQGDEQDEDEKEDDEGKQKDKSTKNKKAKD